ncbi:MAG: ABC transporter permease [Treponema sp.]|nr:ABC transporter permease [Treponema sp.]
MKKNWIFFVASKYIFKGRGNSPVLSILGIAFGVLALIVIIAVMNGFQLSFIENILEISSYHLRAESFKEDKLDDLQNIASSISGIKAAVPFKEFQALAKGRRTGHQAVIVRGLKANTIEIDELMGAKLDFGENAIFVQAFLAGSFDIADKESVLLGSELARRLGVSKGDIITLYSITGILSATEDEGGIEIFTVKGVFRTGYYEYDSSWAFINIDCVSSLDEESDLKLGIKIENRFNDKRIQEQLRKKLVSVNFEEFNDIKLSSWRDYNRSFFGALRTEKLFMFILVGLIFIVVGLNIFQAQRRAVLQRREEIALLRAIGGTESSVRFVFVLDGAVVGFTGAVLGLIIGIAIASNIPKFFSIIENIVNAVIKLINLVAGKFGMGWENNFSVFSPAIFYIKEIPSRILVSEVIIIFMFGFLSALAAAWFASRKISKIQPAEVLRYE